jgi:5-oxoprolinase (ATP-hydrolysing) subunit A
MADLNEAERARKVILKDKLPRYVDLNTDLGQTRDWAYFFEGDCPGDALLNYVSSVNIPCCLHDGHPVKVLQAIQKAKNFNCSIGAHLGFPDPAHFGYEAMTLDENELAAWVWLQLGAFKALMKAERQDFEFVRPHGAMYARLVDDEPFALALGRALHKYDPWVILVGPTGPVLKAVEEKIGLRIAPEIYVGKRYRANGTLHMPRFHENLAPRAALDQALQVVLQHRLTSLDGQTVPASYKTLHLSPTLENAVDVGRQLIHSLGQAVPVAMASIGVNHWIESFEVRKDQVPVTYDHD